MAEVRRDKKGRILRVGESVRKDGRYQFKYTEGGTTKFFYSWKLEKRDKLPEGKRPCIALRDFEKEVRHNLEMGLKVSQQKMTVMELVEKYLKTRTMVRPSTKINHNFVCNVLRKEKFSQKQIYEVRVSDAKLFLIKLQNEDGRGFSSIQSIRGVLRPAFQMAVDDDILVKNPFSFELCSVIINDSVTREEIRKKQMKQFLEFVKTNTCYKKYYDGVYILFHTGMRISEFCGLTMRDIDFEKNTINIERQLLRLPDSKLIVQTTKTSAGRRVLPMTPDVRECFERIVEKRSVRMRERADG